MRDEERPGQEVCEVCEGSGQVCEFRGVSRFVLTWDDCPACGGLGFISRDQDTLDDTETQ
ncbi:MAG: hypothetical protein P4L42_16530 [Desulfocapsaceae bacterium]|nr:hypothetical protein [Desulfocapsaceae bacterium]